MKITFLKHFKCFPKFFPLQMRRKGVYYTLSDFTIWFILRIRKSVDTKSKLWNAERFLPCLYCLWTCSIQFRYLFHVLVHRARERGNSGRENRPYDQHNVLALEAVWQAAAEDHLGAAFIQPGDSVIVRMSGSVMKSRASRVEPRILRPMHRQDMAVYGAFFMKICLFWQQKRQSYEPSKTRCAQNAKR